MITQNTILRLTKMHVTDREISILVHLDRTRKTVGNYRFSPRIFTLWRKPVALTARASSTALRLSHPIRLLGTFSGDALIEQRVLVDPLDAKHWTTLQDARAAAMAVTAAVATAAAATARDAHRPRESFAGNRVTDRAEGRDSVYPDGPGSWLTCAPRVEAQHVVNRGRYRHIRVSRL